MKSNSITIRKRILAGSKVVWSDFGRFRARLMLSSLHEWGVWNVETDTLHRGRDSGL